MLSFCSASLACDHILEGTIYPILASRRSNHGALPTAFGATTLLYTARAERKRAADPTGTEAPAGFEGKDKDFASSGGCVQQQLGPVLEGLRHLHNADKKALVTHKCEPAK